MFSRLWNALFGQRELAQQPILRREMKPRRKGRDSSDSDGGASWCSSEGSSGSDSSCDNGSTDGGSCDSGGGSSD